VLVFIALMCSISLLLFPKLLLLLLLLLMMMIRGGWGRREGLPLTRICLLIA